MRKTLYIFLLLSTVHCLCQQPFPNTISQAIEQLDKHYSDSLKNIIKDATDDELKSLIYPRGEDKTIYNWFDDENSRLFKRIERKGIEYHKAEVLIKAYQNHLLNIPINNKTTFKKYKNIEKKWKVEDKKRFETDSLRGFYIPRDLDDCFKQINLSLKDSTRAKVILLTESEFVGRNHMGYGMWMRNNWQLWGGSRLSKYFNDLGIYHPDDMTGIIFTSFHRQLTNKDIHLEKQVKYYQDYWKESEKNEINRKQKELSEFKKDSTVLFLYNEGYVTENQEKMYDNEMCIANGIITEINEKEFMIKVRLLEACDEKGIIIYDDEDSYIFDKKSKRMKKPKKRTILYMKPGEEFWFSYEDWETKD